MKRIDLHAHTTASDGSLSPTELVRAAKEAGLAAVAVTDHDITAGIAEAAAAGEAEGVEVVPGVEVSAEYKPGQMHILGLLIDPDATELSDWLGEILDGRNDRNPRIVAALQDLGIAITMEEVEAVAGEGAVGRPHIAQVLLAKGVVKDIQEAFDRYLATGMPAYFDRVRATPESAIAQIHRAGGVAILAHCHYCGAKDANELESVIRRLKESGLDGMEVHHSTFRDEDRRAAESICVKLDLLPSGGSDFHGALKPDIQLGVGRGNLAISYEILAGLKEAKASHT